ncbi:hypothetical protein Cgig2_028305 [Carnegiea gigantea]|uniref:Uncharacterized protein n=1 Tax=Carnegiea gigantea TaxID=171969 RepID=A0A9Q1GKM6_9CARY|nr:hypothetical protein Cgig2_028305 [Carnegiea gigantea]
MVYPLPHQHNPYIRIDFSALLDDPMNLVFMENIDDDTWSLMMIHCNPIVSQGATHKRTLNTIVVSKAADLRAGDNPSMQVDPGDQIVGQELGMGPKGAARAGNKEFQIILKEIVRVNKPTIVMLVETQQDSKVAEHVCNLLSFASHARVDAMAQSEDVKDYSGLGLKECKENWPLKWVPSREGWSLLSTDGCALCNPRCASGGGLLHDARSGFIRGFVVHSGHCTTAKAELLTLYRVLSMHGSSLRDE